MASERVFITLNNRGPLLNVINWILLVLMCIATMIKLFSKWIVIRYLQYDDLYMISAMLFASGWAVAVSFQVSAGLGRHMSTLSDDQVLRYQKAAYVSQILYAGSLCVTKMAILQILGTFSLKTFRRRFVHAVMAFNVLSITIMMVAMAFQCPLPDPWEVFSSKCFSQNAFWNAFGVVDILIDLAIVSLPTLLLHDLQIGRQYKVPVIIAFSCRAIIIPIIIIRLFFLNNASSSSDRAFDDFNTVLLTSIHNNLSIVVTCIPFLKPVMDGIQSGVLTSDVRSLASNPSFGYLSSTARKRSRRPEKSKRDSEEEMNINRTVEISIQYDTSRECEGRSSVNNGMFG